MAPVRGSAVGANANVSTGSGSRIYFATFRSPSLGSSSRSGDRNHEPHQRRSRMVEISLSGSGEGSGWATAPGYSTAAFSAPPILGILTTTLRRGYLAPTGAALNDGGSSTARWRVGSRPAATKSESINSRRCPSEMSALVNINHRGQGPHRTVSISVRRSAGRWECTCEVCGRGEGSVPRSSSSSSIIPKSDS